MLTRTARACRCASTSRAPPCRHSHSSSSSNPPPSTRPSPSSDDVRPLDYAAPLYSTGQPPNKWFSALRSGWHGWRTRDGAPHTASTPPSFPSSSSSFLPDLSFGFRPPPPPTPLFEDQPLSQLSHYLTSRGPRTQLSAFDPHEYDALLRTAESGDMPLLGAMVREDKQLRRMGPRQKKQLDMERFQGGKRTAEESEVGASVNLAEEKALLEAKKLAAPPRVERQQASEAAQAIEALTAEVAVEVEAATPTDVEAEEAVLEVEAKLAAPPLPTKRAALTPLLAKSLLTSLVASPRKSRLPIALVSAHPAARNDQRLAALWATFAAEANLSESPADLQLALAFLHYLAAPLPSPATSSPPSPPPSTYLSLSLRVLDSLLAFLPDTVLARDSPPSPSLPQSTRVQALLLRTASNIALSEAEHAPSPADAQAFLALSARALLSFKALRSSTASLAVDEADSSRLRTTTTSLLTSLAAERTFTYRPSTLPSAAPSASSPLALTASLLPLFSSTHWGGGAASLLLELSPVLDAFATEAAQRYRWDLLARVWGEWNAPGQEQGRGKGWILQRDHLKLARWLAGEAPVSTYPSLLDGGARKALAAKQEKGKDAIVRPVHATLFGRLATQTYRFLRDAQSDKAAARWSLTDKNAYLLLLTSSPASTPHTRSIARRLATHWLNPSPSSSGGGTDPFLLSAPAFLSLLRTSLPPPTRTSSGVSPSTFAQPLILSHIRSLVSPSSPFSRASTVAHGKLDHFDLTTLAQAYAIVGDWKSMGEVYGQLLGQRVLPDKRDVEVVVGRGAGIVGSRPTAREEREREQERNEDDGDVDVGVRVERDGDPTRLAQLARSQGVALADEETWQALLRGVVEGELSHRRRRVGREVKSLSDAQQRLDKKVERVCEEARRAGLDGDGIARLREFARAFVPLSTSGGQQPASSSSSASTASAPAPAANPVLPSTPLSPTLLHAHLRALLSSPAPSSSSLSQSFPSPSLPLFRQSFLAGTADDLSLSLLLRCALDAWEKARRGNVSMKKEERRKVRSGVRQVVDLLLPRTGAGRSGEAAAKVVQSRETLDLLLRALVKLDDVRAVDRVMGALSAPSALQPSAEAVESVARWAVAQEGRAALLDPQAEVGRGWVGEKARGVLVASGVGAQKKKRQEAWEAQRKREARKRQSGERIEQ
ncbi:hypothetical protein JCM6882_009080 [Rhodosporidiobolus microsporus]